MTRVALGSASATLRAITQTLHPCLGGAMGAAEEAPTRFHAVTYDPAFAVRTSRRERGNRALETVEIMGNPVLNDLKAFVVLVTTNLAFASAVFVRGG